MSRSLFAWVAWVAVALPVMIFATTAAEMQPCLPVLCGNVSISFPFGIVQEQATESNCGGMGFQVRCRDDTPYLGFYQDRFWFKILNIFYGNGSLIVVDVHKLQDFQIPRCQIPRVNSSVKIGYPLSISARNQVLILYNCTKTLAPAPREGLVETRCGSNTFARVGRSYVDDYRSYFLEGCDTTVVPVRDGSGQLNASRYEELISDGFLVTWQPSTLTAPLSKHSRKKHNIRLILIVGLSATTSLVVTWLVWIMYRQKEKYFLFNTWNELNIEEILKESDSVIPKRFKYSELKKVTGAFKDKLGEGGYGTVFKGNIEDGRKVAVKLLKESKGNGEEFLNEVTSIRKTSHKNVVNLLGFFLDGSKRALVYEYMPNGSLDKYIYSEESRMAIGWERLK